MIDDEGLRRRIEGHMETAEEYIQQGERHRALMEFEKIAAILEAAGKTGQLEQLWAHAAAGFTGAKAPFEAGHSYLQVARLEKATKKITAARDSYLAAANAFIGIRDKTQDIWRSILQAVESAIELTVTLGEPAKAIDLLFKCASIQYRELGYTVDAINSLERAQQLLSQVPNHPLATDIEERLHFLINE